MTLLVCTAWQSVREWCRTCSPCCQCKVPAPNNRAPLQGVAMGSPMQMVAVDILGPLPTTSSRNKYVLVAGDYFTKWMEAYAIPNQEAVTVAKKLLDEMFCRFSLPEKLHSDQGRQFEGEVGELCHHFLQWKRRALHRTIISLTVSLRDSTEPS